MEATIDSFNCDTECIGFPIKLQTVLVFSEWINTPVQSSVKFV